MPTDEDLLRSMFPSSFGRDIDERKELDQGFKETERSAAPMLQKNKNAASKPMVANDLEDDDFGPPMPPVTAAEEIEAVSDQNEEEDDGEDDVEILPITHEIQLKEHIKAITALTLDPSGARLVTGSRDCTLKYWDFSGMNKDFRPFKSIEPYEGNQIQDIQYSPSGDQILVATTNLHPKIYDRNGEEIQEYQKGDPYIRDMRNTKGHVGSLTSCCWNPYYPSNFLTSAIDGTVRIWDVLDKRRQKHVIAVKSKLPGGRTPMTCASYTLDANRIVAAGQDGAIYVFPAEGPYLKPTQVYEQAHTPGSGVSGISFSINGHHFATRGMDDTVKTWDFRKFTTPVAVATGFVNLFDQTNICYSPDEKYLLTGVSVKKDEGSGHLSILDKETLQIVHDVPVGRGSVVKTLWHSKINQIVCGLSTGSTFVLYNPNVSIRGAKMCVGKAGKSRIEYSDFEAGIIIAPEEDEPVRQESADMAAKRKRNLIRKDPILSRKPDMPIQGSGHGGKIGTSITHHMLRGMWQNPDKDEDPREAILKHAQAAASDPYWVAPAYKTNQPKTLLSDKVYENEEEERQDSLKKRRQ